MENNEMTTDKPMSNEEIIEVLKGIVFNSFDRTTPKEREALDLAIKVLEEKPQGEWQETNVLWETNCGGGMGYDYGYYFKCSVCGKEEVDKTNFCSNCGADMRGKQNEID